MAKMKRSLIGKEAHGKLAKNLLLRTRSKQIIIGTLTPPANPRTPAQIAHRSIFQGGIEYWHTLTDEEKAAYTAINPKVGYNPAYLNFMGLWLMGTVPIHAPTHYGIGADPLDVMNLADVQTRLHAQNRPHSDHSSLLVDDHTIYLLASGTRPAHHLIITNGAGHYLQVPILTTAQRNGLTPVNGMIIYNSTTNQIEAYQNGAWGPLGGAAANRVIVIPVSARVQQNTTSATIDQEKTATNMHNFDIQGTLGTLLSAYTVEAAHFVAAWALKSTNAAGISYGECGLKINGVDHWCPEHSRQGTTYEHFIETISIPVGEIVDGDLVVEHRFRSNNVSYSAYIRSQALYLKLEVS